MDVVLSYLTPIEARQYQLFNHVRVEVLKTGDELVAYEVIARRPKILDLIEIDSISIDPDVGLQVHLGSNKSDNSFDLDVLPRKPFGLEVFAFLPLNPGLRFEPTPESIERGTLSFPLVIRTKSRLSMFEQGVVHLEKRKDYEATFGAID